MRVALVNPHWSFEGSIYFGCREPHLPLELGCAAALLEAAGHEWRLLDGALMGLDIQQLAARVADYEPEMTVVTTSPTYLIWRCAQPELRVPRYFLEQLGERGGVKVAIGPHGSATPRAALQKLGCDALVLGEAEEAIVELADSTDWTGVSGLALHRNGNIQVSGKPRATRSEEHTSELQSLMRTPYAVF